MKRRALIWEHVKPGSRCEKILIAIEQGESNEALAKRFNTGHRVIELYRKALHGKLDSHSLRGGQNRHPPEFYAKVGVLVEQGMKAPKIAEIMKVSRNQAYNYIRKYKALKESGKL